MAQPVGTVLTIVGSSAPEVIRELSELPGVSSDDRPPGGVYLVREEDPLVHVASAWVEFFDDRATLGTLEVEVETAVARFRSGDAVMPDYYVVLDPEALEGTWMHWWMGALAAVSPTRVLPSAGSSRTVRRMLGRLPTGRPWPDPARWLPELRFSVPDRLGGPRPA